MGIRFVLVAIALLFARSRRLVRLASRKLLSLIPKVDRSQSVFGIPSNAQPSAQPLGLVSQTVAVDSKVSGERLPLSRSDIARCIRFPGQSL